MTFQCSLLSATQKLRLGLPTCKVFTSSDIGIYEIQTLQRATAFLMPRCLSILTTRCRMWSISFAYPPCSSTLARNAVISARIYLSSARIEASSWFTRAKPPRISLRMSSLSPFITTISRSSILPASLPCAVMRRASLSNSVAFFFAMEVYYHKHHARHIQIFPKLHDRGVEGVFVSEAP